MSAPFYSSFFTTAPLHSLVKEGNFLRKACISVVIFSLVSKIPEVERIEFNSARENKMHT